MARNDVLLRRIRWLLAFFILGLAMSGLTAVPLRWEVQTLARVLDIPPGASPESLGGLRYWIATVREGIEETFERYPFMAYGTDWLAFAHVLLAFLFVGPFRDPVRTLWVIDFGLVACVGVIPVAMIFGPLRGIPFAWRLIDCSFGVGAFVPLWLVRQGAMELAQLTRTNVERPRGIHDAH
jgi:hypothetical protein